MIPLLKLVALNICDIGVELNAVCGAKVPSRASKVCVDMAKHKQHQQQQQQ